MREENIGKLINYRLYRNYRMKITTIQLTDETKKKIASLGTKGESYDDILNRIYDAAVKTQLRELLMDESDTLTIDEARKEVEKEWPGS